MGRTKWFLILAALVMASLVPASAQAPKRVALVIANATYASANVLTNPTNDAAIVTAALRRAGFQAVYAKSNLGIAGFQRALRDFQAQADGAQVALIYYAGHGIEGNGRNWLIPTDAVLNSERDLDYEAINLDLVMSTVRGADLRVVILDACRNNPLGRNWRRGARAVSRGLGSVDADDVLVIYAAAPGETASDGTGVNSPFATALAQRLPQPDLPIQLLGGAVRDDVLRTTGGVQRPFVSASITGTPFYLVPRASGAVAAPPAAPAIDAGTLEALTWQGALGANSMTAFEDYLRQYPQGRFRVQAQQNIARLQAPASTPAVAIPAPQAPRPAPTTSTDSPGQSFRDCGDCPEMVVVPAGSFTMGSPASETNRNSIDRPQRSISFARNFAVGRFEVTRGQYAAFASETSRADVGYCNTFDASGGNVRTASATWRNPGFTQGDDHPVVCVSWEDTQSYVAWLNTQTRGGYRLLSEAEC